MSLARFGHGAVCADLDEDVGAVARRMRDLHVGCVVVTRGARPIGILTDRDLVVRVLAEVVTYDATTLMTSSTLETAARTMREHGARRLPIVTEDGRISEVITADDLVALLSRELADVSQGIADNVDATESR